MIADPVARVLPDRAPEHPAEISDQALGCVVEHDLVEGRFRERGLMRRSRMGGEGAARACESRFWQRFQRPPRVGLNPARLRGIRTLAQRLRGRSEGLALDRRGPPRFGRGLSRPPGECACRRAIPRMRWSGLRGAAAQRARRAVSASTTPPAGEGTGTAGAWSRRTAYLHGLPDDYILPDNYNEACHLTGDGVVGPAVRFLADALIEPRGLAGPGRPEFQQVADGIDSSQPTERRSVR